MHFFGLLKTINHQNQHQEQQQELTSSEEVMDEPPEDEDITHHHDFQDSFDIISDEEVARVKLPFGTTTTTRYDSWSPASSPSPIMTPSSSTATLISKKGSCSSLLSSTGTDPPSDLAHPPSLSVISKKSLSFLFRNNKNVSTAVCQAQLKQEHQHQQILLEPVVEKVNKKKIPPQLTEEEMTSSTTRIWYIIQLQGHYNHGLVESEEEEEGCYYNHPPIQMPTPGSRHRATATATMENFSGNRTNWISSILHLPERIKQHHADKHRFNVYSISAQAKEELKHLYVY